MNLSYVLVNFSFFEVILHDIYVAYCICNFSKPLDTMDYGDYCQRTWTRSIRHIGNMFIYVNDVLEIIWCR